MDVCWKKVGGWVGRLGSGVGGVFGGGGWGVRWWGAATGVGTTIGLFLG
jgi:hypothetical protein